MGVYICISSGRDKRKWRGGREGNKWDEGYEKSGDEGGRVAGGLRDKRLWRGRWSVINDLRDVRKWRGG